MDIAEFLNARWREEEERLTRGWYSDTHWEVFETRVALGAWTVSRQRGIGTALSDEIALAGMNHLRTLQDEWRRQEAVPRLADIAAKRKLLGAHREDQKGRCRTCARWTKDTTDDGHKLDRVAYEGVPGPCLTRRLLALPYAGHAHYDESWRP